nr:actin-binding, cofilin/tropomyosin type [Tanacetum cinerariifolium]
MHNNIMAAGLKDRPPMLATRRYAQWRSRFLRYIDTRPNGDALRKCILECPFTPSTVIILVVPATDNASTVLERTTVETILNMSPENKAHFESEKEAIHLLLIGIGDKIYSTVDACKTAHEMWEAIERLQQGQQHIEQLEFNNKGEVDQNDKQCHDTCPLPAKLTDNQISELSNQSLESENICLKKTVAQFQNDFLRMEAHCVNLELKYQNQALKEGQHCQFTKVKCNEAKVKHDIDVIETINIELEHKMAKSLKEFETLKRHYKELFDSIKITRAKTIEHTTSLIAQNAEFKAQLQERGFAIAALKNELRKLTGNSMNTKFAKSSISGKPVLQPHRNQLVVRQPTVFKSERPRISKPRFVSQVDVNNDLSKPVTTHYLPKGKESSCEKPHHMIAPGSSGYSSNNMVYNHYLEEAKKKTQESSRNSEPNVMPSARSQSTANGSKLKPKINNQQYRNWPASKTSHITTKIVPIVEHSRNSKKNSDSKHFGCSTCQKCVFNVNHDHCVTKFLNEVNSRAKVPSNNTTNKNKPVEQISVAKKPERQIPKGHSSELRIHDHNNEPSSLKLVLKVVTPADKTATSRQELELLFHHHITILSLISVESNSLPHSQAQITKTYYKHQDSRIKKAQELKTKTSANSDIKDNSLETKLRGRLLNNFQEDAKYEHVGQDIRSQGGKIDQDCRMKI